MTNAFLAELDADAYRLIGLSGFGLYVTTYAALCFRLLTGDCVLYFLGNTAAAGLVLIGLSHDFNLAAALIQAFWIAIGVIAIVLRLARSRSDRIAGKADAARRQRDLNRQESRPAAAGLRRQAV